MTRNLVTERYLNEVDRLGLAGDELSATVDLNADLRPSSFAGKPSLSRPAFLDAGEVARLESDLDQLSAALGSLPDRLFGGDIEAFAKAVGFAGQQVTAVVSGSSPGPTPICRGDIYHDGTDFKLMEFNQGSALGGLDVGYANKAQLLHPGFASFVDANGLTYTDPLTEIAESVFIECGLPRDRRPLIAAVDIPESFATLGPQLQASADQLAPHGLDVLPCHLGQLEYRSGRVWLGDRPLDGIYRIFLIEDLLNEELVPLIEPLLGAMERGEIAMFTPMDIDVYGSKAALAMISDEANRQIFDATQLASLDRLLPWTRMVRDEPVTVGDERVDLLDYAIGQREELVLKPAAMHGGIGVVMGWLIEQDEWRKAVEGAVDGPYVVQHRIHAAPEPFPTSAGGTVPMLLNWGVFRMSRGFAGAFVRGSTNLTGAEVNVRYGSMNLGSVFHEKR